MPTDLSVSVDESFECEDQLPGTSASLLVSFESDEHTASTSFALSTGDSGCLRPLESTESLMNGKERFEWCSMEASVRTTLKDEDGDTVFDSEPALIPDDVDFGEALYVEGYLMLYIDALWLTC
jgi:hypothetical protein